jgi:serine/threonine protein kinase
VKKFEQNIGKYRIERPLGSGAMGSVYLAHDPNLNRPVAIKVMKAGVEDEALRTRFFVEGQSVAKLDHANIIKIWGLDTDERSRPYIVMEYIEGDDLKNYIDKRIYLSFAEKVRIISEVCRGLHHAHENGVIHRDVKPSNIRIKRNGEAKILDFGLARLDSASLTRTRGPVGAPYYMSPEQWGAARDLDRRSDLFSVAAVFYELISYVRPFEAETISAVMGRILQDQHTPLQEVLPACPPQLSGIVSRALSKDRDERFKDCLEFLRALGDFQVLVPTLTGDIGKKIEGLESEFRAGSAKSADLEILDLVDRNLLDLASDRNLFSEESSTVDPADFGVLLLRHADLCSRLNVFASQLEATVPLLQGLRTAKRQMDSGQFELCLRTLEKVGLAAPDDPHVPRLRRACQRIMEERRLKHEQEVQIRAVLTRAQDALGRGRIRLARDLVSRVLEIDPAHPDALVIRDAIRRKETEQKSAE